VMLPEYLSDYVILHELAHTRVPDHSQQFWEELDGVTGGQSLQLRRELRSRQIMCFPGELPDQ
jgi:predicted metal-dependent hydrolase